MPDTLGDPRKGQMITLGPTTKLHAASRIPLDPVAKCIAGFIVPQDLAGKM